MKVAGQSEQDLRGLRQMLAMRCIIAVHQSKMLAKGKMNHGSFLRLDMNNVNR